MPTVADQRTAFRRLHEAGCFVLPNPWSAGTARYLERLGFPALATTSAGAAFAMALPDGAVPRDEMLAHVRAVVEATDLPVNADFGDGYAADPAAVAENVRLCAATGVAGLSVEDANGEKLYEAALAVERVRAASAALAGTGVVLTARSECYLVGRPDRDEVIRRLRAFADAGADCLYAPGLRTREDIAAVVEAVAPKPVNVLTGGPAFTVRDLAALGVRRVSVGSALARAAWGGFIRAAREMASEGTFARLAEGVPFAEIDGFFRAERARRGSS